MSSDSLKLCYASVALNPRHAVGWIAQLKTVLERCLTRLESLRPETAADTPVGGAAGAGWELRFGMLELGGCVGLPENE